MESAVAALVPLAFSLKRETRGRLRSRLMRLGRLCCLSTLPLALAVLSLASPARAAAVQTQTTPSAPATENENARYELLRWRERIESDGSSTFTLDQQLLLRTATAVAEHGQFAVPYTEGYGDVEFENIVIEKPDGRTVDVPNGSIEDLSSAGARYKKLTIPGLEAGDRLSYRVVSQERPLAPGRVFGQRKLNPAAGDPIQTYELDLPRAAGIHVRLREGLGVTWEEVPAPADRLVRRLSVKVQRPDPDWQKVTKAVIESWTEPDVIFTSFSSWSEVGHWWWAASRDRLAPDAAIRTEAAGLVATESTPRERVEALFAFVASKMRYVRLGLDAGRMLPRPAAEILANRYGDCKDKHAILAALASSVGIDVRPVFINSYRSELIDDAPTPQQFDHMISVARLGSDPGSWLWLDSTNRFGMPGYLLPSLRDKQALLVEATGEGRIVRTPAEPPFAPRKEVGLKGTLQPDGALRARAVWRFRSDDEVPLRAGWAAIPRDRQAEAVQASLARNWKDGKVTNVSSSDPSNVAEPFQVAFDVERPAPTTPAKGEWNLWVPLPDFELPAAPSRPSTEPIELALRAFSARADFEIPESLSVRAPLSVSLERPFGKFESIYSVEGGRLKITRTMTLTRRLISADEMASYEAFRKTIDTDRDQKFLVLGNLTAPTAVSAEALHTEGLAAFKQKDYLRAVELLRKATEADAKVENGFLDLGRALSAAGQNEGALQAFARQVEIDPFHDSAYAWRAYVLERLGRSEEAEKDFLKQIEVAPFQAWSYERLGERRTGQRRFREAADLYSRTAAIEPKVAGHWVDLAWAQARAGRPEEARAALVRARTLDLPDWMRISTGGVYELIGEPGVAAELAEAGLASVSKRLATLSAGGFGEKDLWEAEYLARAWHLIGAAAVAAGDTAKGERYLDAAWRVWFLPEAAWALGDLREKQGRLAEAVTFWSMAADVPAAQWRLPADRENRIEAAGRRLSTTRARAVKVERPARGAKSGPGSVSDTVTEAESQLLQLRTLALSGPALTNLTEEVLLLVSPDGRVERVRNLSRLNPDMFELQLAKIGPIHQMFTAPDGRAFKAVRRGLLRCSRASSCVIILDLPGMTSSALTGAVKASGQRNLGGAWKLSPDAVTELERKVAATPADLELRSRLLRHYMTDWAPEAQASRSPHALWIIANAPEAEIAGTPETQLHKMVDSEAYEQARSLWLAHLEARGSNPKIVGNAAGFFLLSEPERARELLQRGRELEPVNPQWSERLAHLDMLAARSSGPEARDSARKALDEFESALNLTKDDTKRFYSLTNVAEAARLAGSDEKARDYANELLRLAEELPRDWNYGNAVHEGHRIIGHLELKAGDVEAAKKHLLEAGATPGSPQLNSFGPELTLASEMLARGERDAVVEYLQLISRFWKGREDALEGWIILIREGKTPELNRVHALRSSR
jgi:tetratricopeptide (TPR) repeat protein/transglutaminase-like putative cysteine protease